MLSSIAVSCPSSLNEGTSASGACTATATYSNGSTASVTPTWSSSNTGAATISSAGTIIAGLVTASTVLTINASYSETGVTKAGSASVTVVDVPPVVTQTPPLTGLFISAGSSQVLSGTSLTLTATASYSTGGSMVVTPLWSSNSAAATVSSSGVVTGNTVSADIPVTITASYSEGSVTKTATYVVTVKGSVLLSSLSISGGSSALVSGASMTLTASASYSNGGSKVVSPVWTSNSAVVSVSSSGQVTATQVTSDTPVTVTASYTEGGVTQTQAFSVTILPADSTPDAFSFPLRTGVTPQKSVESAVITVSGINSGSTISVVGGEYSINGGSYRSATGVVNNFDTVKVRVTAPAGYGQTGSATLTIGAVSAIFSVTTQAPTVPTGLTATPAGTSQVNLSWTASTNAVGVTQYKVYRGGSLLATLGAVTNYSDTGLTASTTYSYAVAACDAAGNCSAQSASISTTTQVPPVRLSSLGVSCSSSINEGASGTCTATATYSDASTRSVTPAWSSSTTSVATVSSSGRVTAGQVDSTTPVTINASYTEGGITKTTSTSVNVIDVPAPAPTTITVPSGGSATVDNMTVHIDAGAGSTLTITSGTSGAVITLPSPGAPESTPPEPVTVASGGVNVQVTSITSGATVKTTLINANGSSTTILAVTAGAVQLTCTGANQPFVALGSGASLVVVLTGSSGATVITSLESSSGVINLGVTSGSVTLPASAVTPTNGSPAIQDGRLYAGEVAVLDNSGKVTSVRLGNITPNTTTTSVGAPVARPTASGLTINVAVPNLTGMVARVSGNQSFADAIVTSVGKEYSSQGQNASGVFQLSFTDGVVNALPVGNITVDTSRRDGTTIKDDGTAEVVKNGVITTFAPSVGDFNQLVAHVARSDRNATISVQQNGLLKATLNGVAYGVQPGWVVARGATGQPGFSTDGGQVIYRDGAGNQQTLYPAFADMDQLKSTFTALDTRVNVVNTGRGTASATFQGTNYTLVPDFNLTNIPPDKAGKDWWRDESGKFFIRNRDGSAQGFRVQ